MIAEQITPEESEGVVGGEADGTNQQQSFGPLSLDEVSLSVDSSHSSQSEKFVKEETQIVRSSTSYHKQMEIPRHKKRVTIEGAVPPP
jgi:hypothetical protein